MDYCVDVGADEFFVSTVVEFVVGAEGWLVVFGHFVVVPNLCVFRDFLGVFDSFERWLSVFVLKTYIFKKIEFSSVKKFSQHIN